MNNIIKIAFFMSLFATLISLGVGLLLFFKGGSLSKRYGNKAMRLRVMFQALTLILFFFLLLSRS